MENKINKNKWLFKQFTLINFKYINMNKARLTLSFICFLLGLIGIPVILFSICHGYRVLLFSVLFMGALPGFIFSIINLSNTCQERNIRNKF